LLALVLSGFEAPVCHPEDTVRLFHRLGSYPEGLTGTVLGLQCLVLQNLPARDLMLRRQSQPWTEALLAEIKAKTDMPQWDCLPWSKTLARSEHSGW
jgi:hypothetical protein